MTRCATAQKLRYHAESLAIAAAVTLIASERDRDDARHRPINVYVCGDCGGWHVGHRPKVLPKPSAAVPTDAPLEQPRCSFECKKLVREIIETQGGAIPCCKIHAKRLKRRMRENAEYAEWADVSASQRNEEP